MTGERIHLRMEGQPQQASESAALLLVQALKFCAQPETFPVFMAFAQTDSAGDEWVCRAMRYATTDLLRAVERQIAAGVVADMEGTE